MSSLDKRIQADIREHQAGIEPVDETEFIESVVRASERRRRLRRR